MNNLDSIADSIRVELEVVEAKRDKAYQQSRDLVSLSSKTIRAIHRAEWEVAQNMMAKTKEAAQVLIKGIHEYPSLYFAGYTQDAMKEYTEAYLTYALIRNLLLPSPEELGVEANTWLNGLAEAATEMRRRILDIMRHGHNDEVERLLDIMDTIYCTLVTFDFRDSVTGGLRRRTDTVRAVLERTRGDITTSLRQKQLEDALKALEAKLGQDSL